MNNLRIKLFSKTSFATPDWIIIYFKKTKKQKTSPMQA